MMDKTNVKSSCDNESVKPTIASLFSSYSGSYLPKETDWDTSEIGREIWITK